MKPLTRALGILLLAGSVMAVATHQAQAAGLLTMSPFGPTLPDPIGVSGHYTSGAPDGLIVSVNHVDGASGGGNPNNFDQVSLDGTTLSTFGSVAGLPDEISITTVAPGQLGGWTVGDMFVPGAVGEVNRLTAGGVLSHFASPGTTDFIRGEMAFDRTGAFGYTLIAASRAGEIVEISSNGTTIVPLVNLSTKFGMHVEVEGLTVVPNLATYGPWAGKLLATSPETGLVYAVDPLGNVASWDLGINTPRQSNYKANGINDWESAQVIPAGSDYYQVEYNHKELLTLTATQLAPYVGKVMLVQESLPASLWIVDWDPTTSKFVPTLLAQPHDDNDPSTTGNYNFEQGNFVLPSTPPQGHDPFYTATQGGWGAAPHGNNVGTFLVAHFTQAFGAAGVTIGVNSGLVHNAATFTSAAGVEGFLPAGGKFVAPLSGAVNNPASTTAGEFAGQVLAAKLAVGFSDKGITQSGLGLLKPVSGPLSALTINGILAEADKVLAGQSSSYSRADLNTVLTAFNQNYDGGVVDLGGFH